MSAVVKLWTGAEYLRTKSTREPEQLPLGYDEREVYRHEGERLMQAIGRSVSLIGHKQVAHELGLTEATLSHQIAQRGRHYFRAEHLPRVVAMAPDHELAKALVAPAGLSVYRAPEMTDAERVHRLEQALADHLGPELRAAIFARAYRR